MGFFFLPAYFMNLPVPIMSLFTCISPLFPFDGRSGDDNDHEVIL